ncbi:hypothetical protein [Sulfurovum sp.]|uniref:hypothetical protein n=1 Tax=Sulfurovum sp. TaxID=1969726 RepID=UPI00356A5212
MQTTERIDDETINDFGFIKISIPCDLKEYESISDAPVFTRSKYLVLLGIISFVIDDPVDVFGPKTNKYIFNEGGIWSHEDIENSLVIDKVDSTGLLSEIITKLKEISPHNKTLIFSLLDRWRKARYMEKDSEESLIYTDEATLSYFHVLELLGDLYSKKISEKSKELIKEFTSKYNSEILSLSGQSLENENNAKLKLVSSILSKDISVASKIMYFLKELGLYSNQTAFWIKTLVEARNSVAHGRRVFYDKSIFPVQPFFPLVSNSIYPMQFLRVLAANVISKYLGVSLYSNEWNIINVYLIKDDHVTKEYLKRGAFESIEEIDTNEIAIIRGGLNSFILNKKISPSSCFKFYEFYLSTEIDNEEFLYTNIHAIVILYESTKEPGLNALLEKAIINTHKLECNIDEKFRDTMYFLDFHGFETPKLELLIESGDIR